MGLNTWEKQAWKETNHWRIYQNLFHYVKCNLGIISDRFCELHQDEFILTLKGKSSGFLVRISWIIDYDLIIDYPESDYFSCIPCHNQTASKVTFYYGIPKQYKTFIKYWYLDTYLFHWYIGIKWFLNHWYNLPIYFSFFDITFFFCPKVHVICSKVC